VFPLEHPNKVISSYFIIKLLIPPAGGMLV
jgi:hypothetical protein